MKAIVATQYGPPEVLELREVPQPMPKDSEVLVKIHATTVTAGDTRVRSFTVPRSFWLPARLALGLTKPRKAIPGMVIAGGIAPETWPPTRQEIEAIAIESRVPVDRVASSIDDVHRLDPAAQDRLLADVSVLARHLSRIASTERTTSEPTRSEP